MYPKKKTISFTFPSRWYTSMLKSLSTQSIASVCYDRDLTCKVIEPDPARYEPLNLHIEDGASQMLLL